MHNLLSKGRWLVFVYSILVLIILITLAIAYQRNGLKDIIPSSVPRVALVSAWAGALGGIAISFKGVFDHKSESNPDDPIKTVEWDNQLLPWHLGRPFTGVIVGIFVFIALKAVYPSGDPSVATVAAASFVLGTQERAFFKFVQQIGAVVVSVPQKDRNHDESKVEVKKKR